MAVHMALGLLAALAFVAVYVFDVQAALGGGLYFLGGAFGGVVLFAPSFFLTYAREEKRATLYRLLAACEDASS